MKFTRLALGAGVLWVLGASAGQAAFAPPQIAPALASITWLQSQVLADGSVAGDPGSTADAVLSAVAAGVNPHTLVNGGADSVSYLSTLSLTSTPSFAYDYCASAGKIALALVAAHAAPVAELKYLVANYDAVSGVYCSNDPNGAPNTWDQAFAILALHGAPQAAVARLLLMQLPDGSWEYCCGYGGDSNSTAVALQALASAGVPVTEPNVVLAYLYLRTQQAPSGGFYGYAGAAATDANSDEIVAEALTAFGDDPCGPVWSRGLGHNAITDLLTYQQTDGSISGFSSLIATSPAGLALMDQSYALTAGTSLPLNRAPAVRVCA
jgi:hypothetical protein